MKISASHFNIHQGMANLEKALNCQEARMAQSADTRSSLCHWPSQCEHNEFMYGEDMVAGMEAMRGPTARTLTYHG